jgi:DNA-binding NarL/FixJ family response regulator
MSSAINSQITILIADAEPIYVMGLRSAFGVEDGFHVTTVVYDGAEVLESALKFEPDIVLLDHEIANRHPFDVMCEIRQALPTTRFILIAKNLSDEDTVEAVRNGARAVLLRNSHPSAVITAIRSVYRGETLLNSRLLTQVMEQLKTQPTAQKVGPNLTTREMEIVNLIVQGMRNKEIAARLSISEQTVKNILRNVFDKLGISDRLELALYAIHNRLFTHENSSVTAKS